MVEPDACQDATGAVVAERSVVYRKAGLIGTKGLSLCPSSDGDLGWVCSLQAQAFDQLRVFAAPFVALAVVYEKVGQRDCPFVPVLIKGGT